MTQLWPEAYECGCFRAAKEPALTVRHSLEQAGVLLAVWCYNLEHQFHYSILAQRNCIHRYYSRNQNQAQLRSKHSQFSLIIFISCCLGFCSIFWDYFAGTSLEIIIYTVRVYGDLQLAE